MKIAYVAACAVLGLQLVRPSHDPPAFDAQHDIARTLRAPAEVERTLRRACYDCHSYETQWPWYSQVFPVSWVVAEDVVQGREALNLSRFGALAADERSAALEELGDAVEMGRMPVSSYVRMHRGASLDARERELVVSWANGERERLKR